MLITAVLEVGKHGTALGAAAALGYLKIVKLLIEKRADVNGPGMHQNLLADGHTR